MPQNSSQLIILKHEKVVSPFRNETYEEYGRIAELIWSVKWLKTFYGITATQMNTQIRCDISEDHSTKTGILQTPSVHWCSASEQARQIAFHTGQCKSEIQEHMSKQLKGSDMLGDQEINAQVAKKHPLRTDTGCTVLNSASGTVRSSVPQSEDKSPSVTWGSLWSGTSSRQKWKRTMA
ncbi:C10orf88 [Columba livia]|nr:C10orf88 [Columba livia]